MKQVSLIIGIIVLVGMVIGFIPCLGWFNWLNIPLAIVGLVLGGIDYNNERNMVARDEFGNPIHRPATFPLGIIFCAVALLFGMFRLFIGGGVI